MVIAWQGRITDQGGIRTQFHHIIDIVPTILEAVKIAEPTEVSGVKQKPIEGVSMMYSFNSASAKGTRHVQYFEMFGNRALYKDGWVAACRHGRLPWTMGSYDFDKDNWELYDLAHDFSEDNDVAAQYPDKLKDLQDAFWVEAKKYQVLPLDDRLTERVDPTLRPSLIEGRTKFTYYPGSIRIPESSAAQIKNRSPTYEYNYVTQVRYKVTGSEVMAPGPNTIRMEFSYDGGGLGRGGTVTLFVNDKKVGEGRIEKTGWGRFSADETFDIGEDTGSPVSADYASPNRFTGTLKKVEIDTQPMNLSAVDKQKIRTTKREARLAME